VPDYFVASSAASVPEGRGKTKSVGLRHAYTADEAQTLCGLTIRYLYAVEKEKWTARTPQRCGKCEDAIAKAAANS
jgi:hypothetical protein